MTYNEGSDANPVGKFTVRWRLVFIALSMSLLGSVAMDSGASEVSDLIETRADRLPVFDDREAMEKELESLYSERLWINQRIEVLEDWLNRANTPEKGEEECPAD